ncbi:GGDEF domain-containing protein [Maridesulfovibrio frigidus]|uniref:GGDEF domain-containing protein n=1 Tax=Maridesulfovibrio frigidus TaxID=340956 RepID=UPI0005587939|nr:GGDEF domain-containing protein [Maridesulfovibrio frigidus]
MKPTDLTLNEQLRITSHEIAKRKGLLDISDEDAKILLDTKPIIISDLDTIVEDFYDILVEVEGVAQVIGDAESLYRLKNHLRGYLRSLFDAQYDIHYVQSRLRIGLVHKRIGVPPKLYIAAYKILSGILQDRLRTTKSDEPCKICIQRYKALEKLMLFDLVLVFDTYIQGLVNEVNRSREDLEVYARDLEFTVAERTQQLAEQANKDGMTSLYNQRSFFEHMRKELARAQRRAERFSLCYLDLDHFKQANDTKGHKYGDAVLINVAKAMGQILREEDVAARYGGDEFCIMLPQTTSDMAKSVCNRLTKAFSEMDQECRVTMSIGIAEFIPDMDIDADTLIKKADKAMYASKKQSGHYITLYSDDLNSVKTE